MTGTWFLLMLLSAKGHDVPARELVASHRACIVEEARAVKIAKAIAGMTIKTKCVPAPTGQGDGEAG